MKRKLLNYWPCGLMFIIGLVFFIVGSINDKAISDAMIIENNWFSIIMTVGGIVFTFLLGIVASTIIIFGPERKTKFLTWLQRILGAVAFAAITVAYYSTGTHIAKFTSLVQYEKTIKLIVLAVYVVLAGATLLITWKNKNKFKQEGLFVTAIIIVVIIGVCAGFAEVFKYLASRPRPRVVNAGEEAFRNWYQWKPLLGFKNGECKSFFSGHACNSAILVTSLPLFLKQTKLGEKKYTFVIASSFAIIWSLITSLSRIMGADHYLSDVAFGTMISLVLQIVVLVVIPKICAKAEAKYNSYIPKK